MKTYPSYKSSSAEWLGEIPEHWTQKKLKYAVRLVNEKAPDDYESDFQVALENIKGFTGRFLPTDSFYTSTGSLFKEGDVLFNKLRPYLNKVLLAPQDGEAVGDLLVFRPEDSVDSTFLFYRLLSKDFIDVVDGATYGAKMPRASWDFIGEQRLPFPPLPEQQAIAAYLDRKTAQIDTLIWKRRRLIELLKEQRAAVIARAVTKGLRPDAEMQDSGVAWLGAVPLHWSIGKLKWITSKIGSGSTPRGGAENYQDEGIPFLRSQNVHFDGLRLNDVAYIPDEIHRSMSNTAVESGDVLINITGASIGRCTYVPPGFGEANVNQHVCIVRPTGTVETKFLSYLLSSEIGQRQVFSVQDGSSREGLNFEQLGNFIVPLPPQDEQRAIVEKLGVKVGEVRRLIAKEKKLIDRLKELRTALISEAVTGKIDVREEQAAEEEINFFPWLMLANHIIRRLRPNQSFGRTMLVKVLYVLQHHLKLNYGSSYKRWDHGPLDPKMIRSLEHELKRGKWHFPQKTQNGGTSQVEYRPLKNANDPKDYFSGCWSELEDEINEIVDRFSSWETEHAEVVATTYAAWNDLLLRGEPVTDDRIVSEVYGWHPKKQQIEERKWRSAIDWMHNKGLVPSGFGKPTQPLEDADDDVAEQTVPA